MPAEVAAPPAPAAAPSAPTSSNPALANAFSVLDKIAGGDHEGDGPTPEPRRESTPKPEKKPDTTKPAETKPAEKPAEKPADKPAETPPDEVGDETPAETKPAEQPAEKPAESQPRPSLGRLYRDEQKKTEELTRKLGAAEAALAKAKDAPPGDDPEKQSLRAQVQKLEDHMRFVDYTQSKEYLEQYDKPYKQTASEAVTRATQLKITTEDGSKRNLTEDEFWSIVRIGNEDEAIEAAESLFGERSSKATTVIERRNEILKAHNTAEAAKEKYRNEGVERTKQAQQQWEAQQSAAAEANQARIAQFKELITQGEKHEKMKDVFQAGEGDTEGATLLARYRHEADRAFANGAQLQDGDEPWTPEQVVAKHAVIRNRAGAFPYAVRQLRNSLKKIAELEAKLTGYQKSEPTGGEPATGEAPPEEAHALKRVLGKMPADWD